MRYLILLLALIFVHDGFTQSNEGTDFWLSFMEHRDAGNNDMVLMVTSKENTSGQVEMPGLAWSQSFSVQANQVQLISLPRSAETMGSEIIQNNAIHLTAQAPVSVYMHHYHNLRSEASLVLPVDVLDRSYYVLSYRGFQFEGVRYPSEFLIVGTEDNTRITIELSDPTIGGRARGSSFIIELDEGETYQVQAQNVTDDMTGTFLRGDKNFALFAGNKWTGVPIACFARDNLLEQMYPLSTWGKQFVTVPSANSTTDFFRILASENNTAVQLELSTGLTRTYELDAGEFVEYLEGEASLITSSQPVLIAQYLVGQDCTGMGLGDPSMVLLNSVEQTRDSITLYNSPFENIFQNYISIVTQNTDANEVFLDGVSLADQGISFEFIGPNDEYAFAAIRVNSGSHIINAEGCGVSALAYGYGDLESYAYNGGANFSKINVDPIPEGACLSETLIFDAGLDGDRYEFLWDLGDGTQSRESRLDYQYDAIGTYPVSLVITDLCLNKSDTTFGEVIITIPQGLDAGEDLLVCTQDNFRLEANDLSNAVYRWTGPDNFFSRDQNPLVNNALPNMEGSYSVIAEVFGCGTEPAFMEVAVAPLPDPRFTVDSLFCGQEDAAVKRLTPGTFESYRWQNGALLPEIQVLEEGVYRVSVTNEFGCQEVASITITEHCPTKLFIPNAFSPNDDGINDLFGPLGQDFESIQMLIFDRWGNQVFEGINEGAFWDGDIKGEPAAPGIYTWMVQGNGFDVKGNIVGIQESGDVLLVR